MKIRQVIIIIAAIAIVFIGKIISDKLAEPKERAPQEERSQVTTVFTQEVKNTEIPIFVETTGILKALDRTELFSEVQGVMLPDAGRFKPGNKFTKGAALVSIKSEDQRAQVVASRSAFERLLGSVIPDIKLDFPDEFSVWQNYLGSLNVERPVKEIPQTSSDQLKLFLTGRSIYSEYYALKNREILLSKFIIRAPFNGVLVEANATPGTVIRPGQALGIFIKPNDYELEASVNRKVASRLKKGQEVILKLDGFSDESWIGKVSRVNDAIDRESQMNQFYVRIVTEDLSDGTFMQAKVMTRSEDMAFEIPRSVVFDNDQLFVVDEGVLVQNKVELLHFNEQTVVVRGLKDNMQVLTKVPPGAFAGMAVSIYKGSE